MDYLNRHMPAIRTLFILALIVIPPSLAVGRLLLQPMSASSAQVGRGNTTVDQRGVSRHLLSGSDWPTYLHDIQRTAASGETTLSRANAVNIINHWSFKTGGAITASAIVAGGTAYIGSWDGYEYALDALTGAVKWKTFLGTMTGRTDCNAPGVGITSSAAIQGGLVYLGSDTYWYALDANTGAILWKSFIGEQSVHGGHYTWSSPLIYKGYAYVGVVSEGKCPALPDKLIKVSLSTHRVVATFRAVLPVQTPGIIPVTPSIDPQTNTIYVTAGTPKTSATSVYSLDAATMALKDRWQVPASESMPSSGFQSTPVDSSATWVTPRACR